MRIALIKAAVFLLLTSLLGFALAGCGPERGDVGGKVSFQGKPLCSGSVLIAGSDGVKSSPIQADSTYQITGVPTGLVQISVSSPDPGIVIPSARNLQAPPPPKDNSKWFPIPEDYGDFKKSGLSYDITAGRNPWDIDLK
jgi:hypothetical protein